ncbi:MAG: hypothetical protein V4608_05045 [Bacteroidota bacterium]
MYTLIFKTNIESEQELKEIEPLFNSNTSFIKWNIDTEDVDKVLRVNSIADNSAEIIATLNKAGYHCEELPD